MFAPSGWGLKTTGVYLEDLSQVFLCATWTIGLV